MVHNSNSFITNKTMLNFIVGTASILAIPLSIIVCYDLISLLPTRNKLTAKLICKIIPGTCPFAKKLTLGNHKLVIPPLCKLNPWFDRCIITRFQAQTFLEEYKLSHH
jgi:hypothetical protein